MDAQELFEIFTELFYASDQTAADFTRCADMAIEEYNRRKVERDKGATP